MNGTVEQPEIKEAPCFVDDTTATRIARIAVYAAIIGVSFIANLLVIAIAYKTKLMEKPINLFIINMCIADLLITILYMPRVVTIFATGYEWLLHDAFGVFTCKAVPFLMEVATSATIFTVVVISIDRLLTICFTFKTIISKRASQVLILVIWVLAVAFRFPVLFIKLRERNGKWYCNMDLDQSFYKGAEKAYYKTIMIAIYIIPVLVILLCYVGLLTAVKRFTPKRHLSRQERTNRKARNRNMLQLIVIVITCFITCWSLYSIIFVLDAYKVHITCELRFWRLVLAHLNSAITPCLYFIFSQNYREGLRQRLNIIQGRFSRCPLPDDIEMKTLKEYKNSRKSSRTRMPVEDKVGF